MVIKRIHKKLYTMSSTKLDSYGVMLYPLTGRSFFLIYSLRQKTNFDIYSHETNVMRKNNFFRLIEKSVLLLGKFKFRKHYIDFQTKILLFFTYQSFRNTL